MIQISQPDFKTVSKAVEISLNVSSSNLLIVRTLKHFRQMKLKDYQQGINIDPEWNWQGGTQMCKKWVGNQIERKSKMNHYTSHSHICRRLIILRLIVSSYG